jgi:hypothetical protein
MPPDAGKIWDDGLITVALSGSSVLSSFVQLEPFVTAFHVAVLVPRREMGLGEKLWWCRCIEANQYRYNFGRQANRTLASLRVPTSIPEWVGTAPNTASGELRDSLLEIADSISESSELEKTADLLGKLLKVPKTKAKN